MEYTCQIESVILILQSSKVMAQTKAEKQVKVNVTKTMTLIVMSIERVALLG